MTAKRKWVSAISVILLIAAVLLIPRAYEHLYREEIAQIKKDFFSAPVDAEGLYSLLKAENERIVATWQEGLYNRYSYEQSAVNLAEYGIDNNCVAFVSIPRIGVELPVYLGASKENLRKGAVHMTETSYPIGGTGTNSAIGAHRGHMLRLFREIHKIQIGDEIIIKNFRETLTYHAAEIKIICPEDIQEVRIRPGRDMITLFSCHPMWSESQRYVVYCERV